MSSTGLKIYTVVIESNDRFNDLMDYLGSLGYDIKPYWDIHWDNWDRSKSWIGNMTDPKIAKMLGVDNDTYYLSAYMDEELATYVKLTYARRFIEEDAMHES